MGRLARVGIALCGALSAGCARGQLDDDAVSLLQRGAAGVDVVAGEAAEEEPEIQERPRPATKLEDLSDEDVEEALRQVQIKKRQEQKQRSEKQRKDALAQAASTPAKKMNSEQMDELINQGFEKLKQLQSNFKKVSNFTEDIIAGQLDRMFAQEELETRRKEGTLNELTEAEQKELEAQAGLPPQVAELLGKQFGKVKNWTSSKRVARAKNRTAPVASKLFGNSSDPNASAVSRQLGRVKDWTSQRVSDLKEDLDPDKLYESKQKAKEAALLKFKERRQKMLDAKKARDDTGAPGDAVASKAQARLAQKQAKLQRWREKHGIQAPAETPEAQEV